MDVGLKCQVVIYFNTHQFSILTLVIAQIKIMSKLPSFQGCLWSPNKEVKNEYVFNILLDNWYYFMLNSISMLQSLLSIPSYDAVCQMSIFRLFEEKKISLRSKKFYHLEHGKFLKK